MKAWLELGLVVVLIVVSIIGIAVSTGETDYCKKAEAQVESIQQCTSLRGCTFTLEDLNSAARSVAQCAVQQRDAQ